MITEILPTLMLAGVAADNRESSRQETPAHSGEPRAEHTKPHAIVGTARGGQEFDELDDWLATLPRKTRFLLGMAISALSLKPGEVRSRGDLVCFLTAAGLPISRQAIEDIECRALRKCRRTGLAMIAKEHLIGG